MAPSKVIATGLALSTVISALPGNAMPAMTTMQMDVVTTGVLSSELLAPDEIILDKEHCDGKKYKLTFDDFYTSLLFKKYDPADNVPSPAAYPWFYFSSGWTYATSMLNSLGRPSSAPYMLAYEPDMALSSDQRASINNGVDNTFNVHGAALACHDNRTKEDDCHMTVYGYRRHIEVGKQDLQHVPSCGHVCNLKRFDLPATFVNLTSIEFRAKDDGKPRMFYLDDLEISWNDGCPKVHRSSDPAGMRRLHTIDIDFEDSKSPHDGYMGLNWSGGFHAAIASDSLFKPLGARLARFYPNAAQEGGKDATISAVAPATPRFNARSAYLGCTNTDDNDCNIYIKGHDETGEVASQKSSIPACKADATEKCQLKLVTLNDSFKSLTSMTLKALDDGDEQEFWVDDLVLEAFPARA